MILSALMCVCGYFHCKISELECRAVPIMRDVRRRYVVLMSKCEFSRERVPSTRRCGRRHTTCKASHPPGKRSYAKPQLCFSRLPARFRTLRARCYQNPRAWYSSTTNVFLSRFLVANTSPNLPLEPLRKQNRKSAPTVTCRMRVTSEAPRQRASSTLYRFWSINYLLRISCRSFFVTYVEGSDLTCTKNYKQDHFGGHRDVCTQPPLPPAHDPNASRNERR